MSEPVVIQLGGRRLMPTAVAGMVVRQSGLAGTAGVVTAESPRADERPAVESKDKRKPKEESDGQA